MRATFTSRHDESVAITTFWFTPERPLDYIAGQYIEMTLLHPNPDGRGIKRWFTLSSSPTDSPMISITTKLAGESSSFKLELSRLMPGDPVDITQAMGDFVLPKQTDRRLIFVAGGIGVVPFHSIIKWLDQIKQKRRITFIYAVNNQKDLIFLDLFEDYGLKTVVVVNQPDTGWAGAVGRLNGQRVLDFSDPSPDCLFYVAGPNPFTEAISSQLVDLDIDKQRIVTDYFSGYSQI